MLLDAELIPDQNDNVQRRANFGLALIAAASQLLAQGSHTTSPPTLPKPTAGDSVHPIPPSDASVHYVHQIPIHFKTHYVLVAKPSPEIKVDLTPPGASPLAEKKPIAQCHGNHMNIEIVF